MLWGSITIQLFPSNEMSKIVTVSIAWCGVLSVGISSEVQTREVKHYEANCKDGKTILSTTLINSLNTHPPTRTRPTSPSGICVDIQSECLVIHLYSRECSPISFLIPLIRPNCRADLQRHVPHILTSLLILGRFQANQPLIVPIPAVIGLVLGGETSIAGSSTDGLDFVK